MSKEKTGKVERCVLKVKEQLRKKYPDKNEDEIKESAFKICNSSVAAAQSDFNGVILPDNISINGITFDEAVDKYVKAEINSL